MTLNKPAQIYRRILYYAPGKENQDFAPAILIVTRVKDLSVRSTYCALLFLCAGFCLRAQGNYEIQVYGSDTVAPGRTMIELHSNFTFQGFKTSVFGVLPDNHQLHETLEITQGWNRWFETGFYVFTSADTRIGYKWVGDHIRPRVRVPDSWHWPVGVSLSSEIGYQRPIYSSDTWTWEIRPIIDKQLGRWYLAFNPALERSFHGASVPQGVGFAPGVKIGYNVSKKLSAGLEYYGAVGPVFAFDPFRLQEEQLVPSIDYDFGPNWEFNLGVGVGITHSTDHLLLKMIIGRRFRFNTPKLGHAFRRFTMPGSSSDVSTGGAG